MRDVAGKPDDVASKNQSSGDNTGNSRSYSDAGNGVEEHKKRKTLLNPYGLYPSTVPPFVLEADFREVNGISGSDDKEVKWANFIGNIGSNVAYSTDRRSAGTDSSLEYSRNGLGIGRTAARSRMRGTGIASIISADSACNAEEDRGLELVIPEDESIDQVEMDKRRKIQEEILYDLDTEWKGGERLDAVFNFSVNKDFELKTDKDKADWVNYISKVKDAYYKPTKEVSNGTDNSSLSSDRQVDGKSVRSGSLDWIEELNKEKEKWKRLKQRKLQKWKPALSNLLFYNQYLPLGFRIVIGILCLVSLGLAVRIYQNSDATIDKIDGSVPQQPSTIMAICVSTIAFAYTLYIAVDEFSGKPLGLRDPLDKLKLILLDLLFIIFASANLALAFNTRYDKQWVCTGIGPTIQDTTYLYPRIPYICGKQKALASFLFVLLFAWVVTFSVSIARVVDKVHSMSMN